MIERTIKNVLLKSVRSKPITLVTGARQVGKSTLCYQIAKEFGFHYVSLDDLRERAMALSDPEMFLQLHPFPLIIDEVQYAPGLFAPIEAMVNKRKLEEGSNEGMYLLTGSQAYELMKGVSESMAGRVAIVEMSPLSASEVHGMSEKPFDADPKKAGERCRSYRLSSNDLFDAIVRGMYPEIVANPDLDPDSFYGDYTKTYIERDVSQILNLKDKLKFQNFMEVLAATTGEQLVYDSIAKAVGVSVQTIQSWVSVLLAGGIIRLLQPYNEASITKRVSKHAKLYFTDTGLACYLARLSNPSTLRISRFAGRFVETYLINEIEKSYRNNGIHPNFYYYRDTNQNEIDLVILEGGTLHFVECKTGVAFQAKDAKAFRQLSKTNYAIGASCILCNTPEVYPIGNGVFALPITAI